MLQDLRRWQAGLGQLRWKFETQIGLEDQDSSTSPGTHLSFLPFTGSLNFHATFYDPEGQLLSK